MSTKARIFLTGATGFIGRTLSYELAAGGYEVHALCRDIKHTNLIAHDNIKLFKGDILDIKSLQHAMQGCEQVYHTAAMAKMWRKRYEDFYDNNVIATRNVLQVAADEKVEKIVYTSSCGILGPTIKHPMTESDPRIAGFPIAYERTKYLAELEVDSFAKQGLNVTIVSPSRVFGEGPITDSNTVSRMIKGYLQGTFRFIPGDGEAVANYAYLADVVKGHISAMELGKKGHRYILGGEDISFNQFFNTLSSVSGKQAKMFKLPLNLILFYSYLQLAKTTLTGLPPVILPQIANRLWHDQKYCSNKAVEQLNYSITPFAEALERTCHYIKNQLY